MPRETGVFYLLIRSQIVISSIILPTQQHNCYTYNMETELNYVHVTLDEKTGMATTATLNGDALNTISFNLDYIAAKDTELAGDIYRLAARVSLMQKKKLSLPFMK